MDFEFFNILIKFLSENNLIELLLINASLFDLVNLY